MSSINLMYVVIMVGMGLSGSYFGAAYVFWRRCKADELKRDLRLRARLMERAAS